MRQAVGQFLRSASTSGRLHSVVLYGSVARGTPKSDSDVDLLVRWRGDEAEAGRLLDPIVTDVFLRTGVLLSLHIVDAEHWSELQRIQSRFLHNVEREGVVVEA
jgi:uncharacterized protein